MALPWAVIGVPLAGRIADPVRVSGIQVWLPWSGRCGLGDVVWAMWSGRCGLGGAFWAVRSGRCGLGDAVWAMDSDAPKVQPSCQPTATPWEIHPPKEPALKGRPRARSVNAALDPDPSTCPRCERGARKAAAPVRFGEHCLRATPSCFLWNCFALLRVRDIQ